MNIKTKLRLGIGLLFAMILLLSVIASKYVYILKDDTVNILANNYNSLEYARNMLTALDDMQADPQARRFFESELSRQKRNITEIGEAEITGRIESHFAQLKKDRSDLAHYRLIRQDISELIRINMYAINAKSDKALYTVEEAIMWIVMAGTICFVIALTMFANLPGTIANPISELTASIRQISAKNYAARLHFDRKDEFGQLASSFNRMAEKLEEYDSSSLSRILIEKKRIEALISNMHEPVIGLDQEKIILFANEEAQKIVGLSMSELIGRSAIELSVRNDLIRTLMQPAHTSAPGTKEPPLKIYADNKESYFEREIVDITISQTGEQQKQYIGQVIVLKNVTSFKELDFAKTHFIATVSHELKTPISSIKMSLQLLRNHKTGSTNEQQMQLIESIQEDSDRLLKITGELLNMTQVETGNIQLNIQASSPSIILQYALDAVKITASQSQIRLVTTVTDSLPEVMADIEKTAWVLINFLTNAIRHSQKDSKVLIQVEQLQNRIRFSVTDEGKGIDARYREKIFHRYFQVPGTGRTGTGLGLAISKEFIEAQKGTIGVSSEIGMGSKFYFQLPIA